MIKVFQRHPGNIMPETQELVRVSVVVYQLGTNWSGIHDYFVNMAVHILAHSKQLLASCILN